MCIVNPIPKPPVKSCDNCRWDKHCTYQENGLPCTGDTYQERAGSEAAPACFRCHEQKPLVRVGGLLLCQECIDKTMGVNGEDRL